MPGMLNFYMFFGCIFRRSLACHHKRFISYAL
jgi:hypothetical protein